MIVGNAEGDLHERAPFGALGLSLQAHARFMRQAVGLAGVAWDAGADDVFPGSLAAAVPRDDVIEIQLFAIERLAAVLAGVFVPLEDVVPGKLDLLFWSAIKNQENNHPGNPDAEGDGVDHLLLGLAGGKVAPALEVVRGVIVRAVRGDNLCVALT